jgi:hypothetical protein
MKFAHYLILEQGSGPLVLEGTDHAGSVYRIPVYDNDPFSG